MGIIYDRDLWWLLFLKGFIQDYISNRQMLKFVTIFYQRLMLNYCKKGFAMGGFLFIKNMLLVCFDLKMRNMKIDFTLFVAYEKYLEIYGPLHSTCGNL